MFCTTEIVLKQAFNRTKIQVNNFDWFVLCRGGNTVEAEFSDLAPVITNYHTYTYNKHNFSIDQ